MKKLQGKWSLVLTAITASHLKIKAHFFPSNCFGFKLEIMANSVRTAIAMDMDSAILGLTLQQHQPHVKLLKVK